jgi:hypothetical protein
MPTFEKARAALVEYNQACLDGRLIKAREKGCRQKGSRLSLGNGENNRGMIYAKKDSQRRDTLFMVFCLFFNTPDTSDYKPYNTRGIQIITFWGSPYRLFPHSGYFY